MHADEWEPPFAEAGHSPHFTTEAHADGVSVVIALHGEIDPATAPLLEEAIRRAEAENGRSALLWLGNNPAPAIILLDLMMPEMDGFEFLDTFSHNSAWRDIPVIVITGMSLTTTERERLLGQVKTVITKSASIDADIVASITEAVRRRTARVAASGNV